MEVTHCLVDTITGRNPVTVNASGSWKDSMTTTGYGSHSISLARTKVPRAKWRERTAHWARSLIEFHDGVPKWWGLVKDRVWDPGIEVLTLKTVAPMAVFENRYTIGVGSYATDPTFQITGASLASAVERALSRGIGGGMPTWGPEWGLPLRFHRLTESGSFTKPYPKSDWKTIAKIVAELRRLDGGPDLAIVPVKDNDTLLLDVLTGNPRVSGPTIAVPLTVRNSKALELVFTESGPDMVSGVFARGEGFGEDRKVGLDGYFTGRPADAPPMIVRDVATNTGLNIDDQDMLNSQARAYLKEHTWPREQMAFSVSIEQKSRVPLNIASMRLGARLKSTYSGDAFEPPVQNTGYVVGLSYDAATPDEYAVEVQSL